ncbi:hypothetical protein [Cellulomonas sp.]|uniref:hypothetical protein n=1 Tax=Cellulomonas sp. TaxID=40001 RepID=UPI002E3521B7|nr:hypothetical protein [Cellulomonas sp.]
MSSAGFPDASTTGVPAGTSLTPSGSITISQDGAVIDSLQITGTVTVNANNVTIRRTLIKNTGSIPVRVNGSGLVMEDSEIDGQGGGNPAVAYSNYTLRRVNIHDVAEGPRISGGNVTIEASYIHNVLQVGTNHTDAVQSTGGSNIVLRGNTIQANNPQTGTYGNAAFQYGEENSPIRACTVEGNLFDGGNVTINGGGGGTTGAACSFSGNKFQRDFRYGPVGNLGPNTVWDKATNVWFDTGLPIR